MFFNVTPRGIQIKQTYHCNLVKARYFHDYLGPMGSLCAAYSWGSWVFTTPQTEKNKVFLQLSAIQTIPRFPRTFHLDVKNPRDNASNLHEGLGSSADCRCCDDKNKGQGPNQDKARSQVKT